LLELPDVNPNQVPIEPELSSCREYDIAAQRMSDRVYGLIERVLCPRADAGSLDTDVILYAQAGATTPRSVMSYSIL
jgi:hypothetical protein